MTQTEFSERSKGFRPIAKLQLAGAGQVVVEGNYAYIAHMKPPEGRTIVDISDAKHPKVLSQLDIADCQ